MVKSELVKLSRENENHGEEENENGGEEENEEDEQQGTTEKKVEAYRNAHKPKLKANQTLSLSNFNGRYDEKSRQDSSNRSFETTHTLETN
jgi:hypothetical protein